MIYWYVMALCGVISLVLVCSDLQSTIALVLEQDLYLMAYINSKNLPSF